MKKSVYTIGSLIILLICAFVFVVLPALTGTGAGRETAPSFGKYNGKAIRYEQGSDFANYVSNYGQMMQSYGQQMDSNTYYYIFNQAFNSTVLKMAYTDAVKSSGYVVPQSAVNRQMVPYFSDENGNYSSKLYKQTPVSQITDLHNALESQLYASRFYEDNFGSESEIVGTDGLYGLKVSDAELDFINSYDKEKRGFKMATFSLSDYPDSEKVVFGKENPTKFVKYDLSAITVSDISTANTILTRLDNNEITFQDAVTEYSTKNYTNSDGKLTYKWQYQIENNMLVNKDDISTLKELGANSTSIAIETKNGYAIFHADSDTVEPDFESAELLPVISSYLGAYENTIIEDYFTVKANEFISQALRTSFDKACSSLKINKVEIDPFPLNFGNSQIASTLDTSDAALKDADTNENFLKTAFGLQLYEISKPIILNRNVVVLQYTVQQNLNKQESNNVNAISNFDESSAQRAIMTNKKLVNNFYETYQENFAN